VGLCAEHLRGATAYLSLTAHLHFIPNLNPEVKKIYVPEHRKPQISTTMNVYGNALNGSQARSKHESRQEGTEERITMKRDPQTHQKTLGVFASAVIWGYLGLGYRLIGCGGWI
jgi:hypothetical protein